MISYRTQNTLLSGSVLLVILLILIASSHHRWRHSIHKGSKRVLVTGAAGFIGFHVAKELATNPENVVIGIDNFNEYYDIQLKIDRAYILRQSGVHVYKADICDTEFLKELFQAGRFTHVVHMAAQAGVRYSLLNPLEYIRSNIQGFQAILEVIKKYKHIHLTYASSSSVYGKNNQVPFHLAANTDHPGNIYAATKRADELLASQACLNHGLQAVGLRFFTVYGPWGRPDMAVYKFAEGILDNQDLPIFHVRHNISLGRDFTYISDIVEGVLQALDHKLTSCGAVFNLGFGHPSSVQRMVSMLEEELQMSSRIKKLPLPSTEIIRTWADTSGSVQELGFKPKTDLQTGLKQFVSWLTQYRNHKEMLKRSSNPADSLVWYTRLHMEADLRNRTFPADWNIA